MFLHLNFCVYHTIVLSADVSEAVAVREKLLCIFCCCCTLFYRTRLGYHLYIPFELLVWSDVLRSPVDDNLRVHTSSRSVHLAVVLSTAAIAIGFSVLVIPGRGTVAADGELGERLLCDIHLRGYPPLGRRVAGE